jgi:hypothetical protein
MANDQVEADAIEHVLALEKQAGRAPVDVSRAGKPYDVASPPPKIEVKAYGGSARGAAVPLESDKLSKRGQIPRTTTSTSWTTSPAAKT